MQKILKATSFLMILFVLGIACSDKNDKQQIKKPLNPNGDSELALLMRAMFDEAQQIKQQIARGDSISISLNHERILTAHATEPEKATSPEYQAFAKTYLHTIESLKTASYAQRATIYDNLVSNCMTCHRALCPGPIVKIKKLK